MATHNQVTIEAMVAILDAAPSIAALTGRELGNIVPLEDEADNPTPILVYEFVDMERTGGSGDTREVIIDLHAVGTTKALANALLDAAEQLLTQPALAARGLDACPLRVVRRDVDARSALDEHTFLVTQP